MLRIMCSTSYFYRNECKKGTLARIIIKCRCCAWIPKIWLPRNTYGCNERVYAWVEKCIQKWKGNLKCDRWEAILWIIKEKTTTWHRKSKLRQKRAPDTKAAESVVWSRARGVAALGWRRLLSVEGEEGWLAGALLSYLSPLPVSDQISDMFSKRELSKSWISSTLYMTSSINLGLVSSDAPLP